MNYNLGEEIRKKIVEKGTTFKAFADKFGISDRNLQYVFKKADLPISQIIRASEILDYDFLADYLANRKPKYNKVENIDSEMNEPKPTYTTKSNKISINLTIAGDTLAIEKFPMMLKKLREDVKEFGFIML